MNLKNMKVSTKLYVGFLTIAGLALIIAIVGFVGMLQINQADTELYNGNLLAIEAIGKARNNFTSQRVAIRDIVFYDASDATYSSATTKLATLEKSFDEYISFYKSTIVDQEDMNLYNNFMNYYNGSFSTMKKQVKEYGDKNEIENAQAVLDAFASDAAAMDDLLDQCVVFNSNDASKKNAANDALFITMVASEGAVVLVAVIISLALSSVISAIISRPMNRMKDVLVQAGTTGNLNFDPATMEVIKEDAKAKDEIGQSVKAFSHMMDRMIFIGKTLEVVASGDLTPEVPLLSGQDTMGNALKNMLDQLNVLFEQVSTASEQVNSGGSQVASASQALSQGATEQAASLQELSASIQQIASQVSSNAESARQASSIADQTGEEVARGNTHMQSMLSAMSEINNSSNEIGKIIKVIDDIAFQTNILALNAAVEAARAGAAGKGFAVVAEEVRNLASKSAEAAKQTTVLIEGSTSNVQTGVSIAENTAESLSLIAEKAGNMIELINSISRASQEQSEGISQINIGVEQISSVVQTNSATAEESAAASEELASQSNLLLSQVSNFKIRGSNRGYHR